MSTETRYEVENFDQLTATPVARFQFHFDGLEDGGLAVSRNGDPLLFEPTV